MKNKKIIIAGGTGFIGQAMARYFGKDNHVVVLSRQAVNNYNNHPQPLLKAADGYNITYWRWDGRHVEKHWANEINGSDIVINLAGKSVNCRYTPKNKKAILTSRRDPTHTLGKAIRQSTIPPKLWINASSATAYRHAEDLPQDEFTGEISDRKADNMPYSFFDRLRRNSKRWMTALRYGKDAAQYHELERDFSVQVCRLWEQTFFEERTPFTRKIALRTAITLGEGGVIVPYFNLLKFGLGGRQGSGNQMYSWVHVEDVCRVVEWCADHTDMEGVYNCSAPHPVPNTAFMAILRRITRHRIGLPAFTWMLEIGAALLRTETELILKSRWVLPAKLLQSGFRFKYAQLDAALTEIVSKTHRKKYHLF